MNKFKPFLLLSLVFIAGICVGVVGTRIVVRHFFFHPEPIIAQVVEHDLWRQLELSPEQRRQVHQIMERSQVQFREAREKFRPEIGRIFKETDDEISQILTPEQREKFQRYRVEKQKRWNFPPGPRPMQRPQRP